jgi:DNA modification methylase
VPAWETEDVSGGLEQKEVQEDDFDEEKDHIEVRCKKGDIWQLGDHRLVCGDALSLDTYQALLGDEKADLVFTDPPYGMGKASAGIANDNHNASELLRFNEKWIKHSFDVLTANGSWYCWGTPEPLMDIYAFILRPMQKRGEVTFRNMITWWKGEGGLGVGGTNLRCFPEHSEKCLFVMKGNKGFAVLQDYKIPFCDELNRKFKESGLTPEEAADKVCSLNKSLSENNYEGRVKARKWHLIAYSMFCKPKPEHWQLWFGSMDGYEDFVARYEAAKSSYREGFNYFDGTTDPSNDVWHIPTISADEKREGGRHASVKPQKLCAKAITASSRAGHIVLDCFGGSGSTLIACESLGRRARLIELIPEWCDVIIARWEKFTGKQATKIN